jgi:hypothetical protein
MTIMGFVVEGSPGQYLTHSKLWANYDGPERAWVHMRADILDFFREAHGWETVPQQLHPASYSNGKVTITGEPVPFSTFA